MKYKMIYIIWSLAMLLLGGMFSCSDFLDADPPRNEVITETAFTDDATATSTVLGIYSEMAKSGNFIVGRDGSIAVLNGFSGDELVPRFFNDFFTNTILANNVTVLSSLWQPGYNFIYFSNSLLEGLEETTGITEETKRQLEGEARFIRALCYFYLVNLFGDIPMVTTTDFEVNRLAARTPKEQVYQQIITDLQHSRELLAEDYSFSNEERVRPNRAVAEALLARVYLFMEDWVNAEAQATAVINNPLYHLSSDLNEVFLANSEETIWQLKPVRLNNTEEALYFVPIRETVQPSASLTDHLLNAFEEGDNRRIDWIGEVTPSTVTLYYPFKYKVHDVQAPPTEYSMVLRLAEQYLIRAEARAGQGNITGALEDINMIRNRAGLEDIMVNTQEEVLDAIMHERRVELFAEAGHRWLDLKRTGKIDEVLSSIKTDWNPTNALYPIPQKERESNPNLTQNEGY
ncbi:RagB/SusD family nutrient uptake outer membrane protein [Sinomicrobium weinanense]|uniref:RagB/SusD family nutrient uptake outer membrane protein n=1 Tax=Sinomicrobium weinanense TaxID=2842200 RepID=A0A926JQ02_9FLAO|nr:RagB/SusD family nutrient uptake outer membrane protein [Sinomicrobium weinanense]MBC9795126.1 RagB/SusD family nutrient uptake outer membrane protein [Sinomicrobium weinanense]MBU3123742.1 RagB/SusD family nutrient uptake outer membrane protein [Sinomicrobium weinanense]